MITNLQGTYLSNFYDCNMDSWYSAGIKNAESAYQQMKCASVDDWHRFQNLSGAQAKALGKQVEIRTDWNNMRLIVMKHVLITKFLCNPDLREMLVDTGKQEIIEGNTWNDTYWGVCNGIGSNHLGKILMEIRSSYPVKVTG